jgi:hypothetical protein
MPTPPAARRLADYERQYRDLLAQLSELGFITAGSLASRYNRCGKPGCHCHNDPPQPHGPYWQWTAKVNGKTVNRRLTSRQAALYQQWIANDRRLRAIINDLRAVAAQATELIMNEAEDIPPEV